MKIGIDLSRIVPEKTGVEYYGYELARALIDINAEHEITVFSNNAAYVEEFSVSKMIIPSERANFKWIRKVVKVLKSEEFDLFISPSYFMFGVFFPNTIQIIHDLAPLRYPQYWPLKASIMYRLQLRLATFRTKYFVTNSEFTKQDVLSHYPYLKNKTEYIGTGLHPWAYRKTTQEEITSITSKYNLPSQYILSVSTLQPRKNYIRMIQAFKEVKNTYPELHYVITGKKGWYYEDIFKEVQKLKLDEYVHFLGYVPEEDLPVIFDSAKALLYCSIFEGFGLPAIEAAARGIPSVISDIPVLRETMTDYAFYADPINYKDIVKMTILALKNSMKYDDKFLNSYDWKIVAQRILFFIKDNVNKE